jgi:hypothetical protein
VATKVKRVLPFGLRPVQSVSPPRRLARTESVEVRSVYRRSQFGALDKDVNVFVHKSLRRDKANAFVATSNECSLAMFFHRRLTLVH